jgi:TRAP transporter TAXI family solute receptor
MARTRNIIIGVMVFGMVLVMGTFGAHSVKAAVQKPYEIEIHCGPVGLSTYTFLTALGEIINKNSTWLKASTIESPTPTADHKLVAQNPELGKKLIYQLNTGSIWDGRNKHGAYAQIPYDYSRMRTLMFMAYCSDGLMTLDPNIKTVKDLKGKKVSFSAERGDYLTNAFETILEYYGMSFKDLKRLEYLNFGPGGEALRDRLIDVALFGSQVFELPDIHKPAPFAMEPIETRDVYFVSFPPESIRFMKKKLGISSASVCTIRPYQLEKHQKDPYTLLGKYLMFGCDLSMPDEVVTEILQLSYDHIGEWARFLPQGKVLTKQTMGTMGGDENELHPAALKFFKEKNIPITDLYEK